MRRRVSRRLARADGFTLVELIIALGLSMVVAGAGFTLLATTTRRTNETVMAVDATQRGRTALEQITRALRSQVCFSDKDPVIDAKANEITLYTDYGESATAVPDKRRIALDSGVLIEEVFKGGGTKASPTWGAAARRTLLTPAAQTGTTAVFTYYGYDSEQTAPNTALAAPVTGTSLAKIARIDVAFTAPKTGGVSGGVNLSDQVFVRALDPNDPIQRLC